MTNLEYLMEDLAEFIREHEHFAGGTETYPEYVQYEETMNKLKDMAGDIQYTIRRM